MILNSPAPKQSPTGLRRPPRLPLSENGREYLANTLPITHFERDDPHRELYNRQLFYTWGEWWIIADHFAERLSRNAVSEMVGDFLEKSLYLEDSQRNRRLLYQAIAERCRLVESAGVAG